MSTTGSPTQAKDAAACNKAVTQAGNWARTLGKDMVDILVGPSEELFRVHKGVICQVPYFDKMFNNGFAETIDQVAKLPEDDPITFSLFIQWVYTGRYEKLICEKPDLEESKFMVRIKLYAFAEKIVQPHLMDYTMTALITNYEKLGIVPSPKAMHKAYELTPPNSLLRKFMGVSLHYTTVYYNFDLESKERILDEITKALVKNKDLARDFVLNVNSTGREAASPIMVPNKCIFHVHKDNFDKSTDHCEFTGDVH